MRANGAAHKVCKAIHDLKVERIGHGVQCIKDPALIEEIKARQITLEVCPGSNVALGVDVAPSWAEHPIKALSGTLGFNGRGFTSDGLTLGARQT